MAEHYRFRIGDAFPADAVVARWLTALTMGLNDLLYSNKRLIEQLEGDAPGYENVYGSRLVGAQVWEVLRLLREGGTDPDVAAFIDTLSQDAKTELAESLAVFDDPARAPFKAALARARDHVAHYPEPGRKELRHALAALADQEGEMHVGQRLGDFRGLWADDVAVQLFFRAENDDVEPLKEFVADLRNLVLVLTRFIQRALLVYFLTLPEGTIRPDPD
jgi:hypothetical protein